MNTEAVASGQTIRVRVGAHQQQAGQTMQTMHKWQSSTWPAKQLCVLHLFGAQ